MKEISRIFNKIVLDFAVKGSLVVIFNNDKQMRGLNYRFKGHNRPTDVLAFNLAEPGSGNYIEGEIYVDLQVAAKQAGRYKVGYSEEVARLCIHGLLHLSGFNDSTSADKKKMWHIQERYLAYYLKRNSNGHKR